MKKKLLILQDIWTPFSKSHAGSYASACCYYLLLSIPAGVVVILSILPLFISSKEQLLSIAKQWLSLDSLPILEQILVSYRDQFSAGILSVSFITAIWSAAKGISALLQGLHVVLDTPKNNFIHRRVWGAITIIISVPLTFLLLLLLGSANRILENIMKDNSCGFPSFIRVLAFPSLMSFAILMSVLILVYGSVLKGHKKRNILYISSIVSVACIIVSELFSDYSQFYYANIKHYSLFAVILATMVWIRTLVLIVLYGAILYKGCVEKTYHPIRILMRALKA